MGEKVDAKSVLDNASQSAQHLSDVLLRAEVSRVTFHNQESGFGVLRIEVLSDSADGVADRSATLVGVLPSGLGSGANILARGAWHEHPKFGKQFKARSVTEVEPSTAEAMEKYLGSGAIKGIGPALAERIVAAFGADTLKIIDEDPERLREISGIGEKKLDELKEVWEQKRGAREVMLFFQEHDISLSLAQRIYQSYGERSIETVKKNPYVLSRDVWGIGFATADKIAKALGLDPYSPVRLGAGLLHTLKKASDDGHTFLPRELLLSRTASLLEISDPQPLDLALAQALLEADCVELNTRIYLPHLCRAEELLSELVASRLTGPGAVPSKEISSELIQTVCSSAIVQATGSPTSDSGSNPQVLRLSKEQQEAISLAAQHSLLIITGGPGCGKTTVVRTIVRLFRQAGLSVRLSAPTGRAAQRLSEVCDMEASTIHRLLKYDPSKRGFLHDEDSPLPVDALIVDESSMIDVQLASSLFRALPRGTRLVVVGDADQLPSVGPGVVLADLLEISQAPRVRLNTLFRRANESLITTIAHSINSGQVPHIPEPDGNTKADAYFLSSAEPAEAAQLVEKLVTEQIPKKFGFRGSDITVLSPMNLGDLGIVALNQKLQAKLVPPRPGLPSVKVGNLELRLGDRVCQRVNNYQITNGGVFNGDQGEIIGIDADRQVVFVRLWDKREVEYPAESLYQLDLAYAITVHRSQGSEVPVIVLVLHDSHTVLLERQLVYTAITRAKKLLVIVGTKKALVLSVKRTRSKRRFTGLQERVSDLLSAIR